MKDRLVLKLRSEQEGQRTLEAILKEFGGIKKKIPRFVDGLIGCNGLESVGIVKETDGLELVFSNIFFFRGEAIYNFADEFIGNNK